MQRLLRPGCNLAPVGKSAQIALRTHINAFQLSITIKHRRQLLAGNVRIRAKAAVRKTAHHAVAAGPSHCVAIPLPGLHIAKFSRRASLRALKTEQHRHQHTTSRPLAWCKAVVGNAFHQTALANPINRLAIPLPRPHIAETLQRSAALAALVVGVLLRLGRFCHFLRLRRFHRLIIARPFATAAARLSVRPHGVSVVHRHCNINRQWSHTLFAGRHTQLQVSLAGSHRLHFRPAAGNVQLRHALRGQRAKAGANNPHHALIPSVQIPQRHLCLAVFRQAQTGWVSLQIQKLLNRLNIMRCRLAARLSSRRLRLHG